MYRMDPATGEVLEKHILWSGSGYYSDAVMLGGELFLMDFFDNRLHVIDPVEPRLLRTLSVGAINGIRIPGGMGARSKPNRRYVAAAFGTGLAWMYMGAGPSWFDDHASFKLEVPYTEIHGDTFDPECYRETSEE